MAPQPLEVAVEAARAAGAVLRKQWRKDKVVEHKGAVDLVTETDRICEAIIRDRLCAAFPDHSILGEECTNERRSGVHCWLIDPLDGTTNFAHRYPHFCVSLALLRDGETEVAVVLDPVRRELYTAERGRGARCNRTRLRVSSTNRLAAALLATGFPYDRREHVDFYLDFYRAFLLVSHGVRRSGSAALDLCYVAAGRFDGFWEWKLHPWDTAAGWLIVREAGGRVSDFRGRPFSPFGDQTLASNGSIHGAMSTVIAQVLRRCNPSAADQCREG